MTILNQLASALNRRDEVPNVELARAIAKSNDSNSVRELVDNLASKDKNIASDCIKVLYESGGIKPDLIASYYREFGTLLESRNNRLVWGAMIALDSITLVEPEGVFGLLTKILDAAAKGSVITRDHAVGILAKLGTITRYADKCVPLLLKQLSACPNNQFPMYAEMSIKAITVKSKLAFHNVLTKRLKGLEKESQKKRIEKVLRSL